eukprot:Opistho-2@46896
MADDASVKLLTPPEAFGIVEPSVYRSNSPFPVNFSFLKTLELRTVVVLSPEKPLRAVLDFFEECSINMVHLGLKAWKPDVTWKPVSEELIKECLEIVLDSTKYPVMVMCTSGVHQTGTLVGCLRKLEGWNLTSIVNEYRMYAGAKNRYINEQFIELFDLDLITLPHTLPTWFVDQVTMTQNEKQRLQ